MSLKENVDFVKEELNSEEKFLESFVKVERFLKKYKTLLITFFVAIVIGSIGYVIKQNIDENNKIEANIAFNKVLLNSNDAQAMEILKNNSKNLYDIALLIQSRSTGKDAEITVPYLKELAQYEKALKSKSIENLDKLSMQNDFLLKEFAVFNKALLLTNEGKYAEAKKALTVITKDSKAYELANLLNHYLLTK